METKNVIKYCKAFCAWILAVLHEWITLATGGFITAVIWFWSGSRGITMKPQSVLLIAGLFVFLACFKAWKRERDKTISDEEKRRILVALGKYQDALNRRFYEVSRMAYYDYVNANKSAFEKHLLDGETTRIYYDIECFLEQNIPGRSADFKEVVNLQLTSMNPSPELSQDKKFAYWQATVEGLKHHANQLVKIKDMYAASAGF